MKNPMLIRLFFFALLAMALPRCIIPSARGGAAGLEHVIVSASEQEEETKRREGSRRRGSSLKRISGNPCGDDDDCYDICEDVFDPDDEDRNEGKVRACANVSKQYVIQFEDIVEYLEDPEHISELDNIDERAFDIMMEISAAPWIDVTETANKDEAKILLTWVAKNKRAAESIVESQKNYEGYDKYEGVKELLERVSDVSGDICEKWKDGLEEDISGNNSFIDILKSENNRHARTICIKIGEDIVAASGCASAPSCS